jgi:hypothetical protein
MRGYLENLGDETAPVRYAQVATQLTATDRADLRALVGTDDAPAALKYLRRMAERGEVREIGDKRFVRT